MEKTGGSDPAIGAGKSMIAEVAGWETAMSVYRLLDNEGSLVATVGASGNVTGTTTWAPCGQVIYTTAGDPAGRKRTGCAEQSAANGQMLARIRP